MSKQNEEIDKRITGVTGDASEEIVLRNSSNETCRRIPNITFKIYSVLTAVEELMVKFQGLPVLLKGFLEVFKIIPQEASWDISEAISEKIPDAISE